MRALRYRSTYLDRGLASLGRYRAKFCSLLEHHSYWFEHLKATGDLDYLGPEVRRGNWVLEGLSIETIVDTGLEHVYDRVEINVDQPVKCA